MNNRLTESLARIARISPLIAAFAAMACAPLSEPTYEGDEGNTVASLAPESLSDGCAGGLCIDDATLDRMIAAQAALKVCVPAEEDFAPNDAAGLAIGDVNVEEVEAGWRVDVTFVNSSSKGVWSYPSTSLEVLEGDALVAPDYGLGLEREAAVEASVMLYGVLPCDAQVFSYLVTWNDAADGVFVAHARNNLGEEIKDSVKFALAQQ